MTELHNNRWLADEHEFARRVEIEDVSGFFHKNLTIEPGTRAMILERGESLGEVKPGQYTLQGLTDRLKFWTKKSITAILTREGEVPLDLTCTGLATSEFLEVEANVRLLIQLDDVALFQKNLLGSKPCLTLADLKNIVLPIVQQSLWETIGRLSIKDLTGPLARTDLELCVGQSLGTALARNGLKFTQVQTLSVSHPEYDENRRRVGSLFLQRLAEEEVAKFLQQRDKERLLSADEMASLTETLKNQTADRASVRNQLLRKLDLEQQAELQAVRIDLDFAQKMRLRRHEIALAELNGSEESRAWKQQIERESDSAEHRRQEELKQVEHERKQARAFATDGRADEWEEVQHELRIDRVKGEIELTRVEREERIALRRIEIQKAQAEADFEIDRRKKLLEEEINNKVWTSQVDRIAAIQKMNLDAFKVHQELAIAAKKAEAEIDGLKEDRASQRIVARMQAAKGMDEFALMATADKDQAALIASTVMHKSTQSAVVETAKANATAAMANDARLAELRAQMTDQQRLQYDQMMTNMQQFMQTQAAGFGQFGAILENVTKNLAPQAPQSPTVVVAGSGSVTTNHPAGSPDPTARTVVCAGCRAENREIDRFCRQCGKPI